MDLEQDDLTPSEEWQNSLNATLNRLSTQYLNLLRSASSIVALEGGETVVTTTTTTTTPSGAADGSGGGEGGTSGDKSGGTSTTKATTTTTTTTTRSGIVDPRGTFYFLLSFCFAPVLLDRAGWMVVPAAAKSPINRLGFSKMLLPLRSELFGSTKRCSSNSMLIALCPCSFQNNAKTK